MMLGLMDTPAPDVNKLQKQGQEFKARFNKERQDQSIGQMYWEIAENNLAVAASDKSAERAARRAAVILERVLPRFFQYAESGAGAPVAATAPANAKVKVTLVRWPYT
jgi:hypothetical protein